MTEKLNCLIDYVGFSPQACNTLEAESGMYITSMPGISTQNVDQSASADQINYLELWKNVQNSAAAILVNDIFLGLWNNHKPMPTFPLQKINEIYSPHSFLPTANEFRGWKVTQEGSNFLDTVWVEASFISNNIANSALVAFDLDTGESLYNQPFVSMIGINKITVNKPFFTKNLFIGYDASNISLAQTQNTIPFKGNPLHLHATKLDISLPALNENVVQLENTHGLCNLVYARCSINAWLCPIRDRFLNAWLHLCAATLLSYRLLSDRVGQATILKREELEYAIKEYQNTYKRLLDSTISSLIPPIDVCFPCNTIQQKRYVW